MIAVSGASETLFVTSNYIPYVCTDDYESRYISLRDSAQLHLAAETAIDVIHFQFVRFELNFLKFRCVVLLELLKIPCI